MVNINCSSNCIYQIDGKCTLSSICNNNLYNSNKTQNIDCAYFTNTNNNLFK